MLSLHHPSTDPSPSPSIPITMHSTPSTTTTTRRSHGLQIADQSPTPSLALLPSDHSHVEYPHDLHPRGWHDAAHHQSPASSAATASTLAPTQLKVLFRYGGRIIPSPQNNQLRYTGGESRIVSVPLSISFDEFKSKLCSIAFRDGHFHGPVSVKYQLPSEDLDALISLTCNEDLENMIEEFAKMQGNNQIDRPLSAGMKQSSPGASRIRLFLFSAKNSERSQSDLVTNAKPGCDREKQPLPLDALNQGSNPASVPSGLASIEPAAKRSLLVTAESRITPSASASVTASAHNNKQEVKEEKEEEDSDDVDDPLVIWASTKSYGNTNKDNNRSLQSGRPLQEIHGNESSLAPRNNINQISITRVSNSSHGGDKKQVESIIQKKNEDVFKRPLPEFLQEKNNSTLQRIPSRGRFSHGHGNVIKLVESDQETMKGSEMESSGVLGDPIFDEEVPSLHYGHGTPDQLEDPLAFNKSSATISSWQSSNISPPVTKTSGQVDHVQMPQRKDRPSHSQNNKISNSKGISFAENDVTIPSKVFQDHVVKKQWTTNVVEPTDSCDEAGLLSSAGARTLSINAEASTVQGIDNHGLTNMSTRFPAIKDQAALRMAYVSVGIDIPAHVHPLPNSEKQKMRQQLPITNHVPHAQDVGTVTPWNTGKKLPINSPSTHEINFCLNGTMSTGPGMDHQYMPLQTHLLSEAPAIHLNGHEVQYHEPSLGTIKSPVYGITSQSLATGQDQYPPLAQYDNLYMKNMVDHPRSTVVIPPFPKAPELNSHIHNNSTEHIQPLDARTNPFVDDFSSYELPEHTHNGNAVESVQGVRVSSAGHGQRSPPAYTP